VLYGREDGTEPDGSWAAEGAIEFLAARSDEARRLREAMTFLIIPMLDPDGAAASQYKNVCSSFALGGQTPNSRAFAAWFKSWIEAGKRLDIVINLHNVEGGQVRWHAFPVLKDPEPARLRAQEAFVRDYVKPVMASEEIEAKKVIAGEGAFRFRLGGYLAFFYGPLHIPYELNCQSPARHLTLYEMRRMGALYALAACRFVGSRDFEPMLASISERLAARNAQVQKHEAELTAHGALVVEWVSYLWSGK
jgi:hypothetical protein